MIGQDGQAHFRMLMEGKINNLLNLGLFVSYAVPRKEEIRAALAGKADEVCSIPEVLNEYTWGKLFQQMYGEAL